MSADEQRARLLFTADAPVDSLAAANVTTDHGPKAPAVGQVLSTVAIGEHMRSNPADTSVPQTSEAEVTRVVDVLHEQADRLMVDADRMAQRAAATRAAAAQQDRQADDLEWRADRLHAQADHLRDRK